MADEQARAERIERNSRKRKAIADMQWQEAFRAQQLKTHFSLQLTRPMLEMLCATSDDVVWDRARFGNMFMPDNFIVTETALTKRGLLRRKPPAIVKDAFGPDGFRLGTFYELTPVGVALVEMLKVGGLYIQAQRALDQLVARPGRK